MEFEARALFEKCGLPVLKGITIDDVSELTEDFTYPVVVKAQVATGGRGKLGGIRFAENFQELKNAAGEILKMKVKQFAVEKVMIVEKAEVKQEMYLSILLDRNIKKHIIIFSPCGGMEIEQTAKTNPDRIFKIEIDPLLGFSPSDGLYLGEKAGLPMPLQKSLVSLIDGLYKACKANDCMLAEINPLVVTENDALIALDAKVSVDDSAITRHPYLAEIKASHMTEELVKEAAEYKFLYIPCESSGDVVVMSNGSGMLMSCIDHITKNGRTVSAVLDLGGGATADRIEHAVRILFKTKGARVLFINIFGGITRCDEVALGIKNAVENQKIERPVIVRFEGTNKAKGLEIISGLSGVIYADGLISGVEAIKGCGQ